jgi:hypothetical protein
MQLDLVKNPRLELEQRVGFSEEKAVSIQSSNQGKIKITSVGLNLGRRILASAVLGALTILIPAIASAGPAPHREVRVSRIDSRAIENLQRWASDEDES